MRSSTSPAVPLVLLLLGLIWFLGTPALWWSAAMTAAPFFGQTPSPAEVDASARLLVAALACGLLAPLAGLSLATATRRRGAAALFVVALILSVAAGLATGTLSRPTARDLRDRFLPVQTADDTGLRPCQEHSGGTTRCPGG